MKNENAALGDAAHQRDETTNAGNALTVSARKHSTRRALRQLQQQAAARALQCTEPKRSKFERLAQFLQREVRR